METSKRLRQFWTQRPPYVVFLLCLTCFGLTLFSLSVFVAQTDKIANPDVLDWNKLLSKLTKLEYCLSQSSESDFKLIQQNWTSLFLPVHFGQGWFQAFNLRTQVEVKHLGRGIRPEFQNDVILVTFYFDQSKAGQDCLQVQGPESLLKHLKANNSTTPAVLESKGSTPKNLLSHSADHKPASWCSQNPQDSILTLDFRMDYNPDLTMYVSDADKELIHLHLMVTSVFMFAILAIVIIAFLVRNLTSNKKFIHAEDNRGDHHMIVMTQLSTSEE